MVGEDKAKQDGGNDDPFKAKEKNLLDNVSLMTTISPMPSKNNSLQPQGGADTQDLLDGIFSNTGNSHLPGDERTMSTTTAIEKKLLAHLDDTGTTLGSTTTPPTTNPHHPTATGGEKIMYGFDLSPIHSVDKGSMYSTTQEDLPSTEKLRNRGEFRMAPNFLQAKVVPRQLKSEKSGVNEDTETVMSQVFSSQDVTASINENFLKMPDDGPKLDESTERKKNMEDYGETIGVKMPRARIRTKTAKQANEETQDFTQSLKHHKPKQTITTTKGRVATAKSNPVKKSFNSPSLQVVTPKSPKTRQSAVKVTPRLKTSSKRQHKKTTLQKLKQSMSHSKGLLQKHEDTSLSSPTRISVSKSLLDLSESPLQRSLKPEKETHDERVSLIHILEDLNEMRVQVAEAQDQLSAVTKERDSLSEQNARLQDESTQVKKDNFVIKSRLDKRTLHKSNESPDSGKDNTTDSEVNKLKQDIAEQERLILGYQKENERIYGELKKARENSRETEQAMYEENLRLKSEVAKLNEEVELQAAINKAHGTDHGDGGNYTQALGSGARDDSNHFKSRISMMENQIRAEEGLRTKAEMLVHKVTKERDKAEKQLMVNICKSEEEREKLIIEHKAEMERLKSEVMEARRLVGNKKDALTIRDIMNSPPSKSMLSHFQNRVHKLESDLENRDTVANKVVASVQQQYNDIKAKYEERINDLEKQIKAFRENMKDKTAGSTDLIKDKEILEKKLFEALSKLKEESESRVRERDTLFDQINMLRQQQSAIREKPVCNTTLSMEKKLQRDCELKDQEIERLTALVCEHGEKAPKTMNDRMRRKPVRGDKKTVANYNPGIFEGEGYSDLLTENASLKKQLETKEIEHKHAEVTKEAFVAKLEQEVKTQKAEYERELVRIRENQSEHTKSVQVSGILQEKASQLEKELSHRCKEIAELKNDFKETAASKMREQALQIQIQQLVGKLHDAQTSSPSSGARKIYALEDKLRILGEQLRIKDIELKNTLFQNSSSIIQKEMRNMQSEIEKKNRELTKFRLELDSILLVLKELHSEGVKIPLPKYLQSIF